MIEDIKTLLNIKDSSKDSILNINIRKATTTIKNYLNNDSFDNEYIENNFQDAIIEMVVNAYNSSKGNVKTIKQGNREIQYGDNIVITDSVKNLLPTPYCKMY